MGNWKIAGGDTLLIHSGSYRMGLGAPNTGWCNASYAYDCHPPPLPSGPDADHPTRILGLGWDQGCANPPELWGAERPWQILSLDGASNAVIGCLEITDHSGCVESHADPSVRYERDTPPFGDWAAAGIYAAVSSDVVLSHLNIHGLAWAGGSALALNLRQGNQVSVVNSTIAGQGDCLCLVECDSADCNGSETLIVQNNMFMGYPEFWDPSDSACYIWFEPSVFGTVSTDHNVVFDAKIGNVSLASHNLEENPLVVDANLETFDGHLQAGSPAIDSGLTVWSLGGLIPGNDLEKNLRAGGEGVDRGAYEFKEPTLLSADDLIFQGAFAYPPGDEWTYSGHALAYCSKGDLDG
jgi:hypothetical protein